jgi:hypothetical protein
MALIFYLTPLSFVLSLIEVLEFLLIYCTASESNAAVIKSGLLAFIISNNFS